MINWWARHHFGLIRVHYVSILFKKLLRLEMVGRLAIIRKSCVPDRKVSVQLSTPKASFFFHVARSHHKKDVTQIPPPPHPFHQLWLASSQTFFVNTKFCCNRQWLLFYIGGVNCISYSIFPFVPLPIIVPRFGKYPRCLLVLLLCFAWQ